MKKLGRPPVLVDPQRCTVKLEAALVRLLDKWATREGLKGRSAAVRELIRRVCS